MMAQSFLVILFTFLGGAFYKNEVIAEDQLENPLAHMPMRKPRIINGSKSDPTSRSFFAKAAYDKLSFTPDVLCGATLIWSDIAITAAHCQGAFNNGLLILDPETSDYTRLVTIDRQVRHPQWSTNRQQLNYDLLLIRLATSLSSNDPAKPIPINTNSRLPTDNAQLKAYGYGLTENNAVSKYLREADVTYINNDECWGRSIRFNNVMKSDEVMCTDPYAEKTATCLGDSGGPLTDTDGSTLVGVISFGSGCEADEVPDGHVRLSQVSDWVEQQICNLSANAPSNCANTKKSIESTSVEIVIAFTHDFYPEHTTFAVRSQKTQETLYAGPEYIPERNGSHEERVFLLPGQYLFEVYDVQGNGLVSERGTGSWKVSALYDGKVETLLASGSHSFTYEQATLFDVSNGTLNSNDHITRNHEPSRGNASIVDDLNSYQLKRCIEEQKTEIKLGEMFSIACGCTRNDISGFLELKCTDEGGRPCYANYQTCGGSEDCCSDRQCIKGQCQSREDQERTVDEDRAKIGGATVGGAAGRQNNGRGNLRGR